MHSFGALDFYETRKNDSYDSDDILKVRDLYLPLIGGKAFSLYAFLMSEKPNNMVTHERMLGWLQLSVNEVYNAFLALEAVGLIKTLFQESPTANCFIYCIRSPLGPKDFLNEPLFSSLLRTYIGDDGYKLIESKYLKSVQLPGFKDVSESYSNYFAGVTEETILNNAKAKKAKLETNVDNSKLKESLKSFGINVSILTEEEMDKIGKYAVLYGYDSEGMASIVSSSLTNGKVNFSILEKQCRASMKFDYIVKDETTKSKISTPSVLKTKIELMDDVSPRQFMFYLQRVRPSVKDLKLINSLAFNLNLPNPLINAIIDYTLEKNDGVLTYSYCENLGTILMRKGAKNAKDAMEILNSLPSKKINYKKSEIEKEATPVVENKTEVRKEKPKDPDEPVLKTEEDIKKYLESLSH